MPDKILYTRSMFHPTARHQRCSRWALASLEAGAVLFLTGLAVLYLNPYWHFAEGGFLDHRVHWWNAAGELLTAAGLIIEALALVASLALVVSRISGRRPWPYVLAAGSVFCVLLWVGPAGFTRQLEAHFEWNAADGFDVFRLQDDTGGLRGAAGSAVWQWIVAIQIQPVLRGYFKLNDWQKMNGKVEVETVKILPIGWPIGVGSGGEALQDPDETPLMRAAQQQDLKTVQQLLSTVKAADVNALDQTGQTALMLACQNANASPEVIKALLAAGADVNLRSRNSYTALTWAISRNNGEVIHLLRKAGGRP